MTMAAPDFIAPNMTLGEFSKLLLDLEARHAPTEHGNSELYFNPLDDQVYIDVDVQHNPDLELGGLGTGLTMTGMRKVLDRVLSDKGISYSGSYFKLEPQEDASVVFSFTLPGNNGAQNDVNTWVVAADGNISA